MKKVIFYLILFLFPNCIWSQMNVKDAQNAPFTPQNLITDIFLGEGVEIVNITYDGSPSSIGFFNEGMGTIGLEEGIMLTTGAVESAGANQGITENGSIIASVDNGSTVSDVDAMSIASASVLNVTRYVIEFIPSTDRVQFNYVFASEEYPEFVCSDYSDIFGLFISGPGFTGPFSNGGENIALIPGTNLPVTTNTVNGGVVGTQGNISNCSNGSGSLDNSQYYNDNDGSSVPPVYDGYLTPFTAAAEVTPCQTYTLKIIIADQGDEQRDSGVFLEAKSLSSNSVQAEIVTSSIDGLITEGCEDATLTFSINEPVSTDTEIAISFFETAMAGVDFVDIPSPLIIPAGQTTVDIVFNAIEDDIEEPIEIVGIDFQANNCNRDTFYIGIRDNLLQNVILDDMTICSNESVELDATIPISNESTTFNSTDMGQAIISPPPAGSPVLSTISNLSVNGMDALLLKPALIESVCVNIQHGKVEDLDIYLFAPNGAFIPLSIGNGSTGANYSNTCFSPDATSFIVDGTAPFTGSFIPEGNWDDLSGSAVNGTWQLMVLDNMFGFNGILEDWSITFNATYNLSYSWTPTTGLSCTDCPNPMANPTATTTYSLAITDIYGCSVSEDAIITVIDGIDAPTITCTNITDSSITFEWNEVADASGYEINIDNAGWISPNNGTTAHILNDLGQGQTISVQVMGINDCGAQIATQECMTNDCAIQISTEVMDIDCEGNLGSAAVIVMGGTAPYAFAWDNMATDSLITDLIGGNYMVTVTDASDCTATIGAEINDYTPMTFTTEVTPTCGGATDGTASIIISGGVEPYVYLWSTSAGDQMTMQAIDLPAGTHDVSVTDASNCTVFTTVEVLEEELLPEISAFCANVTSTSITFGWSEIIGITNYEINIDGAGWGSPTNLTAFEETISDLSLGQTLSFEVRVVGGCNTTSDMIECTTNNCTEIVLSETHANLSCFDDNNGSITINATGENPPFSFTLVGGETNDSGVFSNLTAGSYTIEVEDQIACIGTINVTIETPDELIVNPLIITNVDCSNSVGMATVEINGGTYPYTYNWDNNSTDSLQNNLIEGTYTVTVSDANMCTQVASLDITGFEVIVLETSATPSDCSDTGMGTASVNAMGGSGNYTYLWNDVNEQETSTATNLLPGQYEVIVTDSDGCTATATASVSTPTMMEISNDTIVSISCNGAADASISVMVSGGSGDFTYEWDDSNMQTTATASNLAAGNYTVQISDDMGCVIVGNYTIVEPEEITSTANVIDIPCPNDPSGQIMLMAMGGSGELSYLWDNNESTANISNLTANNYMVTITDANNCTATDVYTVNSASDLTLMLVTQDASCENNDGWLEAIPSGGTPNYNYNWSTSDNSSSINNLAEGVYILTLTDANGCSIVDSTTISAPAAVNAEVEITDLSCFGDSNASITVSPSGGTAPFSYSIDSGVPTTSDVFENLSAGNYTINVFDSEGCSTQITDIFIQEPTPLEVNIQPEITIDIGDEVTLDPFVIGGVPEYNYLWDGEYIDLMSCSDCLSPSGIVLFDTRFNLEVMDESGCSSTAEVILNVNKEFNIYAPNAFSPNADGVNDIFTIYGTEGIIVNTLKIFTRWGEKVYESPNDFQINGIEGWDGYYKAKAMQPAVFTWFAEVTFIDGSTEILKGDMVLMK